VRKGVPPSSFLKKLPPLFHFFGNFVLKGTHSQILTQKFETASCFTFGTDRLGTEKGKNLKLENFLLPLFCAIFGKKSQGKWIKKKISVNPFIFGKNRQYFFYSKLFPN
jgi:hypothetical protein